MFRKKFKKVNGNGAMATAQKALNKANKIQKMLDVEKKTFELYDTASPASTGAKLSLTSIPIGNTETARVGDTVRASSFRWRFRIAFNSAGTTAQSVRIILFTDKQNNDPATTDPTLSGTPYGLLYQSAIQSLPLLENANRYTIFWDKTFEMIDTYRTVINAKGYKMMSKKLIFEDSNTNPAKVNNIWVYMISNQATNPPTVGYHFRFKYVDN